MPITRRPFVPGLWHGRPVEPEQSDATDEYSDDVYDSDFEEEFGELYEPLNRGFAVGDIYSSILVTTTPCIQVD